MVKITNGTVTTEVTKGAYDTFYKEQGLSLIHIFISANGVQPVWLDDIGQNYVEYQNGGVNYKIWIEDAMDVTYCFTDNPNDEVPEDVAIERFIQNEQKRKK